MQFRDLKKQYEVLKNEIDAGISEVLASAKFISGPQVKELEQKLAEYVCGECDYVVAATWMTAEEYLAFVKEQSDAIKTSLEQDPLTQTDMNQKSEALRTLWDEALNLLLDEAIKLLPEAEAAQLMAEQGTWKTDVEAAAEAAGKEFEGGSMYPLIVNTEAARLIEERVYKLYELLK